MNGKENKKENIKFLCEGLISDNYFLSSKKKTYLCKLHGNLTSSM